MFKRFGSCTYSLAFLAIAIGVFSVLPAAPALSVPGRSESVHSSSDIRAAALGLLFPINASDFQSGELLQQYDQEVNTKIVDECTKGAGYPTPTSPPPITGPDNGQFPNLDNIRRYGFGNLNRRVQALPSQSQNEAQNAVVAQCQTQALTANPLNSVIDVANNGLGAEWGTILEGIDNSKDLQAGLQEWSRCMAGKGLNVRTLSNFFELVDNESTTRYEKGQISIKQAKAIQLKLGATFATCMQRPEALRERIRTSQWVAFSAQHSKSIGILISQIKSAINEDTTRYHLAFVQ